MLQKGDGGETSGTVEVFRCDLGGCDRDVSAELFAPFNIIYPSHTSFPVNFIHFQGISKCSNGSSKLDQKTLHFPDLVSSDHHFCSSPLDLHTVNNQTLNHLLMWVCRLQATYEFFILLPSKCSPSLLPSATYYLMCLSFYSFFSTRICPFSHNINVFFFSILLMV